MGTLKLINFNYYYLVLFGIVLFTHPHNTDAQSYYWNIGFNINNFRGIKLIEKPTTVYNQTNTLESSFVKSEEILDNTTKIIVFKKTINDTSDEYSQTAMDVITIIWYVATFLALAAFFMLMACNDRRCNDAQRQNASNANTNEPPAAPPTPSPSYSEFAPPSYDTVLKMQKKSKPSVFVIPFGNVEAGAVDNEKENSNSTPVTFYTVNELNKLGS